MTAPHETPQQAARRLATPAIRDGFRPEALHTYADGAGSPLYWRIRLKHPQTGEKWIRPMRLNGEGFALGEPDFPHGKPLYRLKAVTDRLEEPVTVVEGEWVADALARIGVLATTSGAADSAGKADWQPLAGRRARIWPDNDEAGSRYGTEVAATLKQLGCKVSVVDVPALGLPPKGDAVDWLSAHPNATEAEASALPCIEVPESHDDGAT
jgi:putative DNA primase/helicase